jgi:PAS domain S-box-containing protein
MGRLHIRHKGTAGRSARRGSPLGPTAIALLALSAGVARGAAAGNDQLALRLVSLSAIEELHPLIIWLLSISCLLLLGAIALLIKNVRQRKAAEEALLAERARLEAVTENIGAGLAIVTLDYQIAWANQVIRQSYGEVSSRPYHQVFQRRPDDSPGCAIRELFNSGADRVAREQESVDETGQRSWVELIVTPIKDRQGSTVAALELVVPITEQKLAESRLRESEEQFRLLADNSLVGIYLLDENGTFRYVNATLAAMLGYERDDLIGISFHQFIHPEDLAAVVKNLHKRLSGQVTSMRYEIRGLHKNKQPVCLEIHGSTILDGDRATIFGAVLNISARKETEYKLLLHQIELENLNQNLEMRITQEVVKNREKDQLMLQQARFAAIGEMIGNIAHQWRQPLNKLGMVIQRLQMEHERGTLTSERMGDQTTKGLELLLYMSQTIDDFRNFFRPEKNPRPFSVADTIHKAVEFFSAGGLPFAIDIDIPEDLTLSGHVNEFSQVLLNILNNARDTFLERQTISPQVTVAVSRDDRQCTIAIADNGGGIEPGILERVFDPYFTTKGQSQGTGIGLYMSRAIIEKNMGGKIVVRNLPDGAEFSIILPCKRGEPDEMLDR